MSIPTSIAYVAENMYIMCQLRRRTTDDAALADEINKMHLDGSAPSFILALLTSTFASHPVPPSLQHRIEVKEVTFIALKGNSPTYSVRFNVTTPSPLGTDSSTQAPSVYAKGGSPQYRALQEYIHDFVFNRWHVKTKSLPTTLSVSQDLLEKVFFVIPPVNHPHHKPIAFVSGLPPELFGKRYVHLDMLIRSLHTSIRPHLPSDSKLFHEIYFKQSFGLEARTKYAFTKDQRHDVYLAHVSNVADQAILTKIFQSPTILRIMGLPVSFLPIPVRSPDASNGRTATYYGSMSKIIHDITSKKDMLNKLPRTTLHSIRDPTSPLVRDVLLRNLNIITYAVIANPRTNSFSAKLILKRTLTNNEDESTIRSWFLKPDRKVVFTPAMSTNHLNMPPPATVLHNALQQCPKVMTAFADVLGLPVPSTVLPPLSPHHQETNLDDSSVHSAVKDIVPVSKPTSAKKPSLLTPPPILGILKNTPSPFLLSPLGRTKRRASKSPEQSESSPDQNVDEITQELEAPSPTSDASSATDVNDDNDSHTSDELENSIRISNFESQLMLSVSTKHRQYIDHTLLSELVHQIYTHDDHSAAMLTAQATLKKQVASTEKAMRPKPSPKSVKKKKKKSK